MAEPTENPSRSRELAHLLREQAGVIRRRDAVLLIGEERLQSQARRERWQRPWPGVLVTTSGPLSAEQRTWSDLLVCGPGAVLAGPTAAALDGLRGYEATRTHILVPHGRRPMPRRGISLHASTMLGESDVHPSRMPPRTRLPRSLVDAATWTPSTDRGRALIAAGVQQRLVRPSDLAVVLARRHNTSRRRTLLETLADVTGGAEALPELDFVRLLRAARLPQPSRQRVRVVGGRRRYLDADFEEYGVSVEIDGAAHIEVMAWWADMLRNNELVIPGRILLRYPAFVIRDQHPLVAEQIAAALMVRGWGGHSLAG